MRHRTAPGGRRLLGVALGATVCLAAASGLDAAPAAEETYVSNYDANSIAVFPRTAAGDIAPSRTIRAGLDQPHILSLDLVRREIFVANNLEAYQLPAVNVYDFDASYPGNDVPKRTITGPLTQLDRPAGVLVDSVHQELYVANDAFSGTGSSITVYPLGANGNVAPIRTLQGGATGILGPIGMAVDYAHDELIVACYKVSDGGSISFFPRTASDNTPPLRVIQGPHTGLNDPQGIGLDLTHDEIVVANSAFLDANTGSILVFARTEYGDASPLRRIGGPSTQLCNPVGIVLDLVNDEITVANSQFGGVACPQSVTTYARTASGDAAPLRQIGPGPASAFAHPTGVAVTTRVDCSDPAVADGTPCDDGNACTQADTCQAGACVGASPVTCPPPDACHDAGTCDPTTGSCSYPDKVDGTACDDGNACTLTDACASGVCTGGNPVTCAASDQCHDAGVCDTATGACSNPPKADGSPCSDANACTAGDTCVAGACAGGGPLVCDDGDPCTLDACDAATGCSHAFQDGDGDGVCDAQDCAPNDPGAFAKPGELTGLVFEGDKTTLIWDSGAPAAGAGTVSDLARGGLAGFPVGSGSTEECLGSGLAAASATDAATPDPDAGWWYLVRGRNACGSGPYGFRSDGTEDTSSACP